MRGEFSFFLKLLHYYNFPFSHHLLYCVIVSNAPVSITMTVMTWAERWVCVCSGGGCQIDFVGGAGFLICFLLWRGAGGGGGGGGGGSEQWHRV